MKRAFFAAAAAMLSAQMGFATTVGYSTGFEAPDFTTGSINGQDGWQVTNPNYVQSVTTADALSGTQSWLRSNNYATGAFGDQSLSAPLPGGVKAGEATAVGATPSFTQMDYSVAFKAADTTGPDGTFVSLSTTDAGGDRMNYVGISNTDAGGLTLSAFDTTSNGFGNAANFNETNLTAIPLSRDTWHTIEVDTTFVNGPNNDIVKYFVDGTLVATLGSWESYYLNDPEQANPNDNQLFASDRVGFYTRSSPTQEGAASDADAQGLYFDNFAESASAVPLPSSAWAGIALIGGLAALNISRRMRRVQA
jgi:hypothetical protein